MNGNIAIAGAALGGTIALGLIGFKAAEAVGRNPGASGKILVQALLSAALAEGAIFLGGHAHRKNADAKSALTALPPLRS